MRVFLDNSYGMRWGSAGEDGKVSSGNRTSLPIVREGQWVMASATAPSASLGEVAEIDAAVVTWASEVTAARAQEESDGQAAVSTQSTCTLPV